MVGQRTEAVLGPPYWLRHAELHLSFVEPVGRTLAEPR
jgi:hypothetical protein